MNTQTVRPLRSSCCSLASLLALATMLAVGALSACNTTEGVGKDVKSLGKGVEESAHNNK